MTNPTQVEHGWRATARTIFAVTVAVLSLIPTMLATAHLDTTVVGAQVIAVAAAVTRILSLPAVNQLIDQFAPFLSARPRIRE
ncbi:hypothetical protein [Nocardia transvalensis]|uniref:hypothetical protein n=1 Tax=Nocardia transvalensis TaxID=37333 RepID=UPI001895C0F5|nr:hypothetical protein [Nocardia transvalensis]MBF6333452.1 hypothetical protein [Nocardia transvalensis]